MLLAPRPALGQDPFPGLTDYLTRTVSAWNVPGIGIAIVRNDSVLYAKGFGVRAAGSAARVDENTLFEIGSSSKAFTGLLVAMNVSDGKMTFDDHVADHLPGFRLADPTANAQATLRDLLTHRTGVGRGELTWIGSDASRDELLHRVRFLEPESPFRSRWSYQNIMFLAAGEAAARAAGTTWDEMIAQRIFGPLRMTRSATSVVALNDANVARAHGATRDSAFVKPFMSLDNIVPAGSIVSTAHDMAQWLRFQLADGAYQGQRLIESGPFRETHTPQILMAGGGGGRGGDNSERITTFSTYGLGWMVQDYAGRLMWQHGGNTDGSTAAVGMLPDEGLGVVVLSNMYGSPLPGLLMRWVMDRQLGRPDRDLAGEALTRTLVQRARADSVAAANGSDPESGRSGGPPPLPAESFAGTYVDSLYGEVTVVAEPGGLTLRRGVWYGKLEYWNGTNFRWTVPDNPVGQQPFIKFEVTSDGRVTGLYYGTDAIQPVLLLRKRGASGRGGRGGGGPS